MAAASTVIDRLSVIFLLLVVSLSANQARPTAEQENPAAVATSGYVDVASAGANGASTDPQGELLLVQAIFRHGDRTPISLYTNDPYNNHSWTEGLGQMTLPGKERMFHYGQELRKRYANYLDDILLKNVHAQSSPKRRCLETSLSVLAGLFPPKTPDVWSKSNNLAHMWQPIGVDTTEPTRAWLLNPDTICDVAEDIKSKISTDDPEMKKFLEENKEFVEKVRKYSGQEFPSWVQVGWLFDAIFTEQTYFRDRFEMPGWLAQVGNDTLQRLGKFNELQFSIFGHSKEYIKLRSGMWLKQMIDVLKEAAKISTITQDNKKLYTYGTHDTMVAFIMHALGFFKDQPTYGSGLIIELRKDPTTSQPNVHLFYSNVTNNANLSDLTPAITPLKLNQSERFSKLCHDTHCSLDNFATSLKDYLVDNIEKECALPKSKQPITSREQAFVY